ncbi:hypothetical protein [Inquilinus sp. OTU3971]|uniref:hypothetical protein n=1 Tax=Inquilinus sp. OTU3971 TaxID=3043855 RepID=UPI00313B4326
MEGEGEGIKPWLALILDDSAVLLVLRSWSLPTGLYVETIDRSVGRPGIRTAMGFWSQLLLLFNRHRKVAAVRCPAADTEDLEHRMERLREDDLNSVLRRILPCSAVDAAVELSIRGRYCWLPKSRRIEDVLQQIYPDETPEALTRCLKEASALIAAAYEPADQMHSLRFAREPCADIMAEFQRNHPGFSERSYRSAIDYGLFVTR